MQPSRNHPGRSRQVEPVKGAGKYVTAGNASQLSDGAAAVVLMEAKDAEKRGLHPLGRFVAWAAAGCEPDEMGIGPVFAVPKLLKRHGLTVDDIDLWELNEAFASQFSDGASACVVMDAKLAEKRNLRPLGIFRGFAVAGCEPDEMGIGPVFAIPRLLKRHGLKIQDIDLWELNEAFASQCL